MKHLHPLAWLTYVLTAMLALHPAVGWAQESAATEARARQYYAEGTSHFQEGRYSEAGAAFAAGFELSAKPGFLWNMGECARLTGNDARALELYRRYVKEAPDGSQRAEAEKHIRELAPKVDPPAASASVPPPKAPPPAILLQPKPHQENDALKPTPADTSKPVYQRWWFWTGAAAIVAGAVVAGVVLSSGGTDPSGPSGPTVDWRSQ